MNYQKIEVVSRWQSPSNIALVKYWGKKGLQIPCNPSISITLDKAISDTSMQAIYDENQNELSFDFYFEDTKNPGFEEKLKPFLIHAQSYFKWLQHYHVIIHSSNTFPHSSGIASSASAYSALALNLCTLHEAITGESLPHFFQTASYWARIGSGSACRSVYGGYNAWGESKSIAGSHDEFAVNIDSEVHPHFKNMMDSILIVEKGKKAVSSTMGHALLKQHPFAEKRYETAYQNIDLLMTILKSGDMSAFIQLVESEALMLHSLMMSSPTPFILMKPQTLQIIEKVIDYRNQTAVNVMFTLDAGANVHLLYPEMEKTNVQNFIANELVQHCENGLFYDNKIGTGPSLIV